MSPMLDQLDWDEVEKKIESVQMHGGQWAHGPGWVGSDAEAPSHLLPDQLPPAPPNLVPKAPPASLGMVGTLLSWIDAGASGGRHRLTCTPTAPQSQSCPITAFPILEIYLHSLFRPYICNPYSHNIFAFPILAIYLHYLFSQYICIQYSQNISAFPILELYICKPTFNINFNFLFIQYMSYSHYQYICKTLTLLKLPVYI